MACLAIAVKMLVRRVSWINCPGYPQHFPQKQKSGFSCCMAKANDFLDGSPRLLHCWMVKDPMPDLIAYVDGGSHGSPGPSGIGVLIEKPNGEMIRIAKWIGHHDNNVAEYAALLEALQRALDLKATSLSVL